MPTLGDGRQHVVSDRGCPSRFPLDCHPVGVTPKGGDVVLDPLEGKCLIQQPHVTSYLIIRQAHKAKGSNPGHIPY